jgi:hypothetical protein
LYVQPCRARVELERCEHFPIEQPGITTLRTETAAFLADVVRAAP